MLSSGRIMNAKDFLRLGVPLGEATRRATDFVARYVLRGGDTAKLEDENTDLRSLMPGAKPVRTHQHHIDPHPVARPGEKAT